jgi:hypothetical protein
MKHATGIERLAGSGVEIAGSSRNEILQLARETTS